MPYAAELINHIRDRIYDNDHLGRREWRICKPAGLLPRSVIEKILTHLGLDPQPLPRASARESLEREAG